MASAPAPSDSLSRESVAPWWHTLFIVAAVEGLSFASYRQHGLPTAHLPFLGSRLSSYVTITTAEWLLAFAIWIALRRRGLTISRLVGGRWISAKDFFRDCGLALAFFALYAMPVNLLSDHVAKNAGAAETFILPKTAVELVAWLLMSATAGFCEELIFRGYLTAQFTAWTGNRWLAIIAQAVLFGLGHGYYGAPMIGIVMLLGFGLGLLTQWRHSLRPAIVAHGFMDALGGVAAFFGAS
jgi:membrane protease YdiL (CAAX protease family)